MKIGTYVDTFLSGWALSELKGPTLLNVRLDPGPKVDPKYQELWGWKPGVPHTVVLFRRLPDGRFVVGDPATGRELWSLEAMQTLWHGEGLRLVPRDPQLAQRPN